MADGFSLNIDTKFMQDLEKAEQKLKDIAENSDKTSKAIIKNFQEATDKGIGYFLSQMRKANEQLMSFSNASKNMKIGDVSGLSSMNKMASQSTDIINKLIDALVKLSSEQSKSKSSSSKDSDVSKINSLYRERIKLMKQLEHFAQLGAKGMTLTNEESSSISSIHQRLQVIDMEIKSYQKRTDLSKQAIRSLIQGEADFSIAQGNEIRKRQKLVEDENRKKEDKVRQESLHNEKLASLDKKRAEDIVKQHQKELNDYRAYLKSKQDMYKRMFDQIAKQESQMRSKSYNRFQTSGDTSNQATAAYNRLYGEHGVKSVNNMNRALQRLQDAQNKLNLNTDKGRQKYDELGKKIQQIKKDLDKATQSNEKFHNSHSKLLNTSDQLQRKLALLFSVSAIQGYMDKLVNVRKEFELQQKSLQVLLQNKDEANKLWNQTLELAVKSPFRVKELVTYTRQLAAYRIETSKLHDTTRRLADVSAGLGVDMQRLILAFGQVRAANYLRGTELRQFTEAGIPMLDELAKHFTELEGKAISAGDVFEMISKRMVAFEDVEAVFKKMTSEGGAFFQMQEEQSKTLAGMISNLHDSVDLMLNDIGQQYDGIMKGSINFARVFVDNWKLVGGSIQGVITALAGYKLYQLAVKDSILKTAAAQGVLNNANAKQLTMLQLMRVGWGSLTTTMKGASATMKSVLAFNAPLLAVTLLIKGIWELGSAMNEHKEKLEEISNEYDKLRERAGKIQLKFDIASNEGNIKEQRSKLNELVNLANNEYHMSIKVDVEKLDTNELQAKFNEIAENMFQTNIFSEHFAKQMQKAREWVVEDDIFKDLNQLETKTNNLFNELALNREKIVIRLKNAQDKLTESKRKALEILSKPKTAEQSDEDYFKQLQEGYKALMSNYEQYAKVASSSTVGNVRAKNIQLLTTEQKVLKGLGLDATKYLKFYGEWNEALKEAEKEFNAFAETINLDKSIPQEQKEIRLTAAIDKMAAQQDWDDFVKNYIYKWTNFKFGVNIVPSVPGKEELQAWQKTYNQKFGDLEATLNIDESYAGFKKITKAATTHNEVIERLNSNYETTEKLIKQIEKAGGASATQKGGAYEGLDLEELKKELKQIDEQRKWLGNYEKDKGKGKDWMSEVVKGIKEAHQEYVKLNKTLGKSESKQMALDKYAKSFAESAKNAGLKDISLGQFSFETEEGAIDALEFLKNKLPQSAKQARFKLEEAIGEIRGEVRIRTKVEDDKLLIDQIEDMFSGYEMSIELQKLNIPKDLAKQLFNLDSLTLPELESKTFEKFAKNAGISTKSLIEEFNKAKRSGNYENLYAILGKDMTNELKETLNKIDELEDKEQKERLKKYTKYLLKAQSERVKIKLEEMRQLAEIEKENAYTDSQKETIKRNLQIETQEKIDKQAWDDFKNSEMYTQMFSDLEHLGTESIKRLKASLESLKESLSELPASDLKEIMQQISKLEELEIERNPFASMRDAMSEVDKLRKKGRTEKFVLEELANTQARIDASKEEVDAINVVLNARKEKLSIESQSAEWQEKYRYLITASNDALQNRLNYLDQAIDKDKKIAKQAGIDAEAYVNARKATKGFTDNVSKWGEAIKGVLGGVNEVLDAFGVAEDDTARLWVNNAMQIADMIVQVVILTASLHAMGAAANTALGVVGWIAMALQGVAMLFASIFGMGDKRKERQIQREMDLVNDLEHAYKKLEKAIDNAYSIDSLESSNKLAKSNLNSQINAYERMIAVERDKKKTDDDKIKEWNNTIDELREYAKELDEQAVSIATNGIFDSVLDASQEFTDAWLEAFNETGDGLKGLEQNFKETMLEMVKRQAAMLITDSFVQKWKNTLNNYINPSDLELTTNEAREWVSSVSESLPQLSEALERYFLAMKEAGVDITGGNKELSGLQRGIQGITEETAQIIEAYMASVRFYVADSNSKLTMIANQIVGSDETTNPMLSELRSQTELIRSIRDMFSGVIRNGHPTFGGAFIKVAL